MITTHGYLSLTPPLALAVREGRKTQTMRPLTPQPVSLYDGFLVDPRRPLAPPRVSGELADGSKVLVRAPYAPDDVLWVREGAMVMGYTPRGTRVTVTYDADGVTREVPWPERLRDVELGHRIPNGCHREAARTYVRVLSVEPRRVQSITHRDAVAEGWPGPEDKRVWIEAMGDGDDEAIEWFAELWDSLYRARGLGWDADPWCWMVRFERVEVDCA